ncbi:MAG: hypothetical protein IKG87_04405 [Clostridia bacterium]|nr:hypothetical protein [Clostridia bacterium]
MNKASFVEKAREAGKIISKAAKHIFLHNGLVKLLALLISLVLWAGLISQDNSLTRDKSWQNVNVSVNGLDTLKRNGFIVVSDLEELLANVSVTAAVPQKQYDYAEASSYNVRVDLSRINGTGTHELKIQSSTSSTFGKLINTTPSSVSVEVEEYVIRPRIPVAVTIGGEYQNGWYKDWYMPSPSVDPLLVAVSGPKDLVQTILRAKVVIDPETLEWTEGNMISSGIIKLFNSSNEEVDSSLLEITTESLTIDTVLIEGNVLPARTFSVADLIELQGEVKEGYEVASVRISPETVKIAARSEVLSQLEELVFDRTIDLQDLDETTSFPIKIQKPSEDAVLSNDTINVTVEIEPVG